MVLGARSLAAALRGTAAVPLPEARGGGPRPSDAFRQGVVSNLGNPKMAAFFAGLFPAFAPHDRGALGGLLLLGLLFSALTLVWLAAYAVAVAALRRAFQRSAVRRSIEGAAGAVLVALGVRLALERR